MANNLKRFIIAQEKNYELALEEIKRGRKQSHWMWYIFPQLKKLGHSATAEFYGIVGKEEAIEYLKNDYLKNNLVKISEALYDLEGDISNILGYPDDLKLKSCMTLFNFVDPSIEIFQKVIDKFYDGEKDHITLDLVRR